jgi:hypothetical protein
MFLGSKLRRERRAVKLTVICEPIVCTMLGSLTSHNPIGLHGLLRGEHYLYFYRVFTIKALEAYRIVRS